MVRPLELESGKYKWSLVSHMLSPVTVVVVSVLERILSLLCLNLKLHLSEVEARRGTVNLRLH